MFSKRDGGKDRYMMRHRTRYWTVGEFNIQFIRDVELRCFRSCMVWWIYLGKPSFADVIWERTGKKHG